MDLQSLCPTFRTQSESRAQWDTPVTPVSGCKIEASLSDQAKLILKTKQNKSKQLPTNKLKTTLPQSEQPETHISKFQ